MDFALDPETGDLALDETGDLIVLTKREAIAQHVRIRWQFILGEWILDQREGVPWFEQIWVADPSLPAITELFRRTTAETPGIASVRSLRFTFDPQRRELSVANADIVTTDGEAIGPDDFRPFVIVQPAV